MGSFDGAYRGGYCHDGTQLPRQYASSDVELDALLGGPGKYGKLTMREDRADLFEQFLAPKGVNIEYVPVAKSYGIAIPLEGRFNIAGSSNVGTVMAHSYIALDMRDVGKFVSKIGDFVDAQRQFMKNDAGIELQQYMDEQGLIPLPFKFIGVFAKGDPGIMGVRKANKAAYKQLNFPYPLVPEDIGDAAIIYINEDAYQMIKGDVIQSGATAGDIFDRGIAEEYAHLFRDSFSRIAKKVLAERAILREEKATKQDLISVYGRLVDKAVKPSEKARYQKVIKALEHDIATIERYRKNAKEQAPESSLETLVAEPGEGESSSGSGHYQGNFAEGVYLVESGEGSQETGEASLMPGKPFGKSGESSISSTYLGQSGESSGQEGASGQGGSASDGGGSASGDGGASGSEGGSGDGGSGGATGGE
ncbi:hypothetical protein HYU13_03305 [Candidatus Woesearchaeota archaeon]|nr:hypothetical protein [Candidatus Woesearchaeota archaeon]